MRFSLYQWMYASTTWMNCSMVGAFLARQFYKFSIDELTELSCLARNQ